MVVDDSGGGGRGARVAPISMVSVAIVVGIVFAGAVLGNQELEAELSK